MVKKVKPPPSFKRLMLEHEGSLADVIGGAPVVEGGKYLHWDELRHREPPEGLTPEKWWLSVKMARKVSMQTLPVTDKHGRHFRFCQTRDIQKAQHLIDSRAAGRIAMPTPVSDSGPKERFVVRSLIEESITSSQMGGASTTYKAAMSMFRSGRQPANKAERMIFNNWLGMRFIKEHMHDDLTPELVLELHAKMTKGTLSDDEVGRVQTPADDRIGVYSNSTQEKLHAPPASHLLPKRMAEMCDFANAEISDGGEFLHPIIRAIMLHFWLAYDHPFSDGNGRTARALFYWSMLRAGYRLFDFVAISPVLKRTSAQYGRAFQYTETDENDATYFINFQLSVISKAVAELEAYLERKTKEIVSAERRLKASGEFKHRQLALLSHALRKPHAEYTFKSHSVSHDVTLQTARADLQALVKAGLLDKREASTRRQVFYTPSMALAES